MLLLDLQVHTRGAEGELDALGGCPEVDPHAVLVLHRRDAAAAGDCRARTDCGVGAVEIIERLQVVDRARRRRREIPTDPTDSPSTFTGYRLPRNVSVPPPQLKPIPAATDPSRSCSVASGAFAFA